MDCGAKCLKYILFVFNFLFWVLGIAVLGVGIYSRVKSANYDSILGSGGAASAANILIASGVFVALIGFVGCCGALKSNKTMLIIYFILVLLIFILEIAAGALAYTKRKVVEDELTKGLLKVVDKNYVDASAKPDLATQGLIKALDWFQKEVKCCGATGPDEWKTASLWYKNLVNNATIVVPPSCCIKAGCDQTYATSFKTGCISAGKQFVIDHVYQVGGVGVGIAIVQILVMVAAILLCRSIGEDSQVA